MKRTGMILAAAMLVGLAWTSSANAARSFFVCQVHAAGMSIGGALMINLTEVDGAPAFANKWFTTIDLTKKEMLATVLTALATGQNLWVAVDPLESGFPVIDTVFLRE